MTCVLVVDDEPNVRYSLETGLKSEGVDIVTAATGREGIDTVRKRKPDAVILDVRLPDMSGLDALNGMREEDPQLPVIVLTASTNTSTAIEAMKRGAFEYLLKPADLFELKELVNRALEVHRLNRVPAVLESQQAGEGEVETIVGRCERMQAVYKAIGRIAPQDTTVLIEGESGTGKELVARAIHHYSRRNQGPFMAVHCSDINEVQLESELFGHERGAFAGADRPRIGKLEQCRGGTLFLEEVADLSPGTQTRLLRLLQEQSFERMGGNDAITTDVRVICATRQSLDQLVAEGRFRQDLYYRLNVFPLRLPPLRERGGDLPLLIDYFIRSYNRELGKNVRSITAEALETLESYNWPGNVRELQGVIKSAMIATSGEVIAFEALPLASRTTPPSLISPPAAGGASSAMTASPIGQLSPLIGRLLLEGSHDIYRQVHAELDRVLLNMVLREVKGNQFEAAERLGISRTTLRVKLRGLGLAVEKRLAEGGDE